MLLFPVFSRTNLAYPSRRSSLNPRPVNLLQPLCSLLLTPILCFQQLAASFSKTPGVGGLSASVHPRTSNLEPLHLPVTCATWHLYPPWPQSIAHTSCHHGGVPLRTSDFLQDTRGGGVGPLRLTVAPAPDLYHPAHLEMDGVHRMRFHKLPLQCGNPLGALIIKLEVRDGPSLCRYSSPLVPPRAIALGRVPPTPCKSSAGLRSASGPPFTWAFTGALR